jgi:hypothetical protein
VFTVAELQGDPENKLAGDALLRGQSESDVQTIMEIKLRLEDIAAIISETGGSDSLCNEQADLLSKLTNSSRRFYAPLSKAHHNIATQFRAFIQRKLNPCMPCFSTHLTEALKLDYPHFVYSPNPRIDWKF